MSTPIVPSSQQPMVGDGGRVTPPWLRFFNVLAGIAPSAIAPVDVGASPFAYTAGGSGTLRVSGGTVSSITLTRSGMTVAFGTTASVPVANGDVVTIAYSVKPTISFIPA